MIEYCIPRIVRGQLSGRLYVRFERHLWELVAYSNNGTIERMVLTKGDEMAVLRRGRGLWKCEERWYM